MQIQPMQSIVRFFMEQNNGANLGFEKQLWAAADALHDNMDAAKLDTALWMNLEILGFEKKSIR
jgi:hypothetical protein